MGCSVGLEWIGVRFEYGLVWIGWCAYGLNKSKDGIGLECSGMERYG